MPFVSFDPDPTNPTVGWATDEQGRQVNVSTADMPSLTTLPPSSTTSSMAPPVQSSAPPPPPEPMMSMAPEALSTAPPPSVGTARTASEVLSKLDKVPRSNSGLVASGRSTTTMAGRDPNAVAADVASVNQTTGDLAGAVTQAGDQRAQRAETQAQHGAGQAVAGFFDAQAELAAAEAERKAVHEQQLKLETTPDPQVDPDRYVKSMSTGKDIGLIILGALNGAFRGLAGQGGNDVVDILNKRIDQDVEVQKTAAANGRADRTNKVAQLMERGHDLETAAKLAKVQAREYAAKLYEQEAAAAGAAEFREQAALDAAKIRATGAAEIRQLVQSGESRTQTTNTFARPAAGKAVDTGKAIKEALELDKILEERGYDKDRRDATLKAAGLAPPTGKTGVELAREKPTELQVKNQLTVDKLKNMAAQLEDLPKEILTRESRPLPSRVARDAADYVFGEGSGDATLTPKELADKQTFEQIKTTYASLLSVANQQGALAGPEYERAVKAAGAMNRPAQMKAAISNLLGVMGVSPEEGGRGTRASAGFNEVTE